jgi:hypothetical protein
VNPAVPACEACVLSLWQDSCRYRVKPLIPSDMCPLGPRVVSEYEAGIPTTEHTCVCADGLGDQQKNCRLSRNRCLASSVGIAAGWTPTFRFPARTKGFSLPQRVQTGPGAHPAYAVDTGWGAKRPRRGAHRSPPSSAEVKNAGAMPPFRYTSSWCTA